MNIKLEKKYIKLPLNTKTLLPLRTISSKTYSYFLLWIPKGNINHQRVEKVEMHSYSQQN